MIRNVVFDMGSTLLEWHPISSCLRVAGDEADAMRLREAIFAQPWWVQQDGGLLTEEEVAQKACEYLHDERLAAMVRPALANLYWESLSRIPAMEGFVDEVLNAGYHVYLLSNAGVRLRDYQVLIPRVKRFDGLLVSAEEKLLKPDAAIYHRFCEKFDVRPEECFFVDDLPENIEGARACGWQGHVFDGNVDKLRAVLFAEK